MADVEAVPVQRPTVVQAPRPADPVREVGPEPLTVEASTADAPTVEVPITEAPTATSAERAEIGPASPPPGTPLAPAPRAAAPTDAVPDEPIPDAVVHTEAEPPRRPIPHRGVVADFRIGTLGCIGGLCRRGHDVRPGVRLGGFLGGNVRGWFEAGVSGGWGTLGTNVTPGTNAMLLYGLDPGTLQQLLWAQAAGVLQVDLAGLAVQDAKLRAAQVGPSVRIHLVPRGRVGAFVGSGVGYNVLRARYQTAVGQVGLDFHGIEVPVEANLSVYVLEHLAVGLQFDYMWTWYGVAVLDHPQQRLALPVAVLQAAGELQGVDLRGQLPQLWTLGLAVRGRL